MAMMKVLINNGCVLFIEMRNLKIPATGNPCVLTVGLSINITTFGE